MVQVNAMGDACPIPVVKTKNAMKGLGGAGELEVLVDNEVAVQNVTKMAQNAGCEVTSEKLEEKKFCLHITVKGDVIAQAAETPVTCVPDGRSNTVVVISSDRMGNGNDELGKVLVKGFLYALSQQDELPSTILFYNGGATITCEDSPSLEDLKSLEAQGVEIMTCGTCLNYYNMTDKLKVGTVTNMYTIVEKMTQATKIIKP